MNVLLNLLYLFCFYQVIGATIYAVLFVTAIVVNGIFRYLVSKVDMYIV